MPARHAGERLSRLVASQKNIDLLPRFWAKRHLMVEDLPPKRLAAIWGFRMLTHLSLHGVRLTDLEPLRSLEKLSSLNLSSAHGVTNLSPLLALPKLTRLEFSANKRLTSYGALSDMPGIANLGVSGGFHGNQQVDSLEFLRHMTGLRSLYISRLTRGSGSIIPALYCTNLASFTFDPSLPLREWARIRVCLPETELQPDTKKPYYLTKVATGFHADGDFCYQMTYNFWGPSKEVAADDPALQSELDKRLNSIAAWIEYYENCKDPRTDTTEKLPAKFVR